MIIIHILNFINALKKVLKCILLRKYLNLFLVFFNLFHMNGFFLITDMLKYKYNNNNKLQTAFLSIKLFLCHLVKTFVHKL